MARARAAVAVAACLATVAHGLGASLRAAHDGAAALAEGDLARLGGADALAGASGADERLVFHRLPLAHQAGGDRALRRKQRNGAKKTCAKGGLDDSFGRSGVATTSFGGSGDVSYAMAVQPQDQKIVVVGTSLKGLVWAFAAVRYLPNGDLDDSFGNKGKVTIQVGDRVDNAYAVAIQPDGGIVIAGTTLEGFDEHAVAVRLLANGEVDESFGTDGVAIVDLHGNGDDQARALLLQADAKIVLIGYSQAKGQGDYDFAVARLNANGDLDQSFGAKGVKTIAMSGGMDKAFAGALQADGKIIVAGQTPKKDNSGYDFAVVRLLAGDGALDKSFSGDGIAKAGLGLSDFLRAVAIGPDGSIFATGHSLQKTSGYDFALVKFNSNGVKENSFVLDVSPAQSDFATGVVVGQDGRVFVAGYSMGATNLDFVVAAFTSSGEVEEAFGTAGRTTVSIGTDQDHAYAIALQSDGKVLVSGYSAKGHSTSFSVARLCVV